MTETGTSFSTYTRLYKEQWPQLMEMHNDRHTPLHNYANGSVATTWTISFKAIQQANETAANLLLLWAHLDNKNLWHGLLVEASRWSNLAAKRTAEWLGEIMHSEMDFIEAIRILRAYSLVEEAEDLDCYSTHPVVHQWAFHIQDDSQRTALSWLAVVLVGLAVPSKHEKDFWETQTKLLPHAEQCETCLVTEHLADQEVEWGGNEEEKDTKTLLEAVVALGNLYLTLRKFNKAEKMYMLVLRNERNLSKQSNVYGLDAAFELSNVYRKQEKISEAKELLFAALEFQKRLYGEEDPQTLWMSISMSYLYNKQGKFDEAEETVTQALNVCKRTLGESHSDTLLSLRHLGWVYFKQKKYDKAENILLQVLEGRKKTLSDDSLSIPATKSDLGEIYSAQDKFEQAEMMFTQSVEGYEKILGPKTTSIHEQALRTMWRLGMVYLRLDNLDKARECYSKALSGYEKLFGEEHETCQALRDNLAIVDRRERDSDSDSVYETSDSDWSSEDEDLDGLDEHSEASVETTSTQERSYRDSTEPTQQHLSLRKVRFRLDDEMNPREPYQPSTSAAPDDQPTNQTSRYADTQTNKQPSTKQTSKKGRFSTYFPVFTALLRPSVASRSRLELGRIGLDRVGLKGKEKQREKEIGRYICN
jgi:tetratricopeptide (TPR) repeat protein